LRLSRRLESGIGVIDVRGSDGHPPYVIRWADGHEGICIPGPEARIAQR
jgi:hypothetical protein